MSIDAQMIVLLFAVLGLYMALPLWLALRGWILTAGFVQLFAAVLPQFWQSAFCRDCAGNFWLLIATLLPLPLLLIAAGLIVAFYRIGRWAFRLRSRQTG